MEKQRATQESWSLATMHAKDVTNTVLSNVADTNVYQVTDYLLKRGFNRTEEVFRSESKHLGPDGKPIQQLANTGPKKYAKSFNLLKEWVENNLEIYKVRLIDRS